MSISQKKASSPLLKRDPFAISMQNFIPYGEYFVTALVGTPAQEIELLVDTGSSDIWMFGEGSCTRGTPCEGGQFDLSASTSAAYIPGGRGAFEIQYQTPGSGVIGDYITDNFSVGGVTVRNQVMAVATRAAEVPSGIMGIGLAVNEAAVSQGLPQYQNFPDLLVNQSQIASKSYSLYLDDLATSTGTILVGGYDEAKFQGELTLLPLQRDDQSGTYTSFTVAFTGLGVNTPRQDLDLDLQNFLYGAILDTGTTLTYLPTALYQPLAEFFQAEAAGNQQDLTLVDCDYGKRNPGQVLYTMGGDNGVTIAVDFDELVIPIYSNRDGEQLQLQNGQPACQFGLSDAGEDFSILFGQTFLRSAYVLYDLDNLKIGLAQTIFDAANTNVIEYDARQASDRIETQMGGPVVTYATNIASAVPGEGAYGSFSFAPGSYYGGSATGIGGAQPTNAVQIITTMFDNLPSYTYPSESLPTAFPTVIPPGATGTVGTGANADGSPFDAGQGPDQGNPDSGTNEGGSSSNQRNEDSGAGEGNDGSPVTPTFAAAGTLVLSLLFAPLLF